MNESLKRVKKQFHIIGESRKLHQALEVAQQVAPTDMSVLIHGESGTGKESLSKVIHAFSQFKHGKLVAINCGAIPSGTIDSELFGHVKGAFTGAEQARKGYFEEAKDGTIFLDEVGELPPSAQARLLRVLEYKEFLPVGSSQPKKIQVRVVAASHKNLLEQVEAGLFREDLYYRINTVPIYIPPLREREGDILLLFKRFALDFAATYHRSPIRLTATAQQALRSYRFPGNIRELKNIVGQLSLLEGAADCISGEQLQRYLPVNKKQLPTLSHFNLQNASYESLCKLLLELQLEVNQLKAVVKKHILQRNNGKKNSSTTTNLTLDKEQEKRTSPILLLPKEQLAPAPLLPPVEEKLSLEEGEKKLIQRALIKHHNKRGLAAKEVGISERTLYRKIKQYGLLPKK